LALLFTLFGFRGILRTRLIAGRLGASGLLGFAASVAPLGFRRLRRLLGFLLLGGLVGRGVGGCLGRLLSCGLLRRGRRLRLVLRALGLLANRRRDLDYGSGPAGGLDLALRRDREPMRVNRQFSMQVAGAEHLDPGADVLDDAGLEQRLGPDLGSVLEPVQAGQVEHREALAPLVVKAAQLRDAHGEPRLATLEGLRQVHRGASALPLLATGRGLAMTRAGTAAHALTGVVRAWRRLQLVQLHDPISSTRTRWRTLCTMPRSCGLSSCSTVWCRRRRPSACTVRSWSGFCPITLRTYVTFKRAMAQATGSASGSGVVSATGATAGAGPRRLRRAISSAGLPRACAIESAVCHACRAAS